MDEGAPPPVLSLLLNSVVPCTVLMSNAMYQIFVLSLGIRSTRAQEAQQAHPSFRTRRYVAASQSGVLHQGEQSGAITRCKETLHRAATTFSRSPTRILAVHVRWFLLFQGSDRIISCAATQRIEVCAQVMRVGEFGQIADKSPKVPGIDHTTTAQCSNECEYHCNIKGSDFCFRSDASPRTRLSRLPTTRTYPLRCGPLCRYVFITH